MENWNFRLDGIIDVYSYLFYFFKVLNMFYLLFWWEYYESYFGIVKPFKTHLLISMFNSSILFVQGEGGKF